MEEQDHTIAHQETEIRALASQLQKASDELELIKFATGRIRSGGPAPRVVTNQ